MSASNPPKPTVDEDDIDDLDDVLDQFNPASTSSSQQQQQQQPSTQAKASASDPTPSASAPTTSSAPTDSASPAPPTTTASAADTAGEDDMNLPAGFEDLLSQQFAKELAQGMEEMFGGLKGAEGGSAAGSSAGAGVGAGGAPLGGDPNAQMSEEEMMKQFEKIMAEMGLGEGSAGGAGAGAAAGASGTTAGPASTTTPPAGGEAGTPNFQDAIRSTMSRLRQSESSSSSGGGGGAGNPFGDFSEADMAKLLEGLGGEGGMPEGEEGMAKMLESMMGELMSKEVLHEPLKELRDKYPPYLASPTPNPDGSAPSEEDLTRYKKQYDCVRRVVTLFEDPKYDGGSDAEKKALKEQVGELMNEMQEAGAPPQEIVGDLPAELEGLPGFGGDGGAGPDGEQCVVM